MSSTNDKFGRTLIGIAVNGYDDAQDLRTASMNRVRDLVRKRNEGIPFDAVEDEKDPDERSYDKKYQDENLPDLIAEMEAEETLTPHERKYIDMMLTAAEQAAEVEEKYKEAMEAVVNEPIYDDWLQHVNGVGSTLAARLVHQFGYCEIFANPSQLWKYCGYAPGQERTKGEKLDFNPDAKTLGWLVADRMIMQGKRSRYKTEFYDPYKEKQERRLERSREGLCIKCGENANLEATTSESHVEYPEAIEQAIENGGGDVCRSCYNTLMENGEGVPTAPESQGHADARARRYLAKKFLKHYAVIARDMQGINTQDEWVLEHGGHDKLEDSFEEPMYAKREAMPG